VLHVLEVLEVLESVHCMLLHMLEAVKGARARKRCALYDRGAEGVL